ncbi:MAG: hypothetical protein V4621_05350 [Pseudomonadota bacterium]
MHKNTMLEQLNIISQSLQAVLDVNTGRAGERDHYRLHGFAVAAATVCGHAFETTMRDVSNLQTYLSLAPINDCTIDSSVQQRLDDAFKAWVNTPARPLQIMEAANQYTAALRQALDITLFDLEDAVVSVPTQNRVLSPQLTAA